MQTRVRWTVSERERLAWRILELRRSEGLPFMDALHKAQDVLEEGRRRKFIWRSAARLIEAEVNRLSEMAAVAQKERPVTAPAPSQPPSGIEELISALAQRIANKIADEIHLSLRRRAEAILGAAAAAAVEGDRQRKRKVMIIGGTGKQHAEIQKEFGKLLDLRTISPYGASHTSIPQARDFQGLVLIWTDFVPHSVYDGIPKEKIIQVSGGVGAVKDKLTEIYCMDEPK